MPCAFLEEHFPKEAWPGLACEFKQPYMQDLCRFLSSRASKPWHPDLEDVFAAFRLTPQPAVRVVIVGQDPYPDPSLAIGLAFSVREGVRPHPASLRNIFHELQTDLGVSPPMSGDLTCWARQDVLLLNRTLTVRKSERGSHRGHGWAGFTRAAIDVLAVATDRSIVFLLWGGDAKRLARRVKTNGPHHHVFCASHPVAPGGFFGQRHFLSTDAILGAGTIDWACVR